MSANFEAKKVVVEEIKEKIQNSKSVVFVKFEGLSVAEDTELRREFRKNNVEYKVLKNTLIKRAFNDLGITDFDDQFVIHIRRFALGNTSVTRIVKGLNDCAVLIIIKLNMIHRLFHNNTSVLISNGQQRVPAAGGRFPRKHENEYRS